MEVVAALPRCQISWAIADDASRSGRDAGARENVEDEARQKKEGVGDRRGHHGREAAGGEEVVERGDRLFRFTVLSDYEQHFLPLADAEAASERRFFRGCSGGARLSNSDASVRKASSTFVEAFADVSRKHAARPLFRASSVDTALPGRPPYYQ